MAVRTPANQAPAVALDNAASAIASARRAVLADRYAANSFSVEWRDLTQLAPIVEEWRTLAARALEPNVFYEPAFALAAAPVFGRDAGAMLVWSGSEPRRLLGFFPARVEKRRYGVNLPVLVGWTHPYAPFGLPLVEREAAEPITAAWLAHLAADATLPGLVLLPYLPLDSPFALALDTIGRRAQMPTADFDRHERAQLAPSGERSHYVEQALSKHHHKELRRCWRRSGDATIVRTDSCATTNHPMIDRLWRERLVLCNRLIAVRPQAPFSLARGLERLRSAAIAGAKSVRERIRRRKRPQRPASDHSLTVKQPFGA
jgi:hypothetical protein